MPRFKIRRLLLAFFLFVIIYFMHISLSSLSSSTEEEDIAKIIEYQKKDPIRFIPNEHKNVALNEELEKLNENKRNWHDVALIFSDSQRVGPGEQGRGVYIPESEKTLHGYSKLLSVNGFNALASDKISYKRSVKDIRHPQCKKKLYLKTLPSVSVVIPFHDEHFSTLVRSVHSIVKNTPPELLVEIILVDDYSTKSFLNKPLEEHMTENFKEGLVKIIRNKRREGLIRTRMAGADISQGEIIIFFDSHIECNVNWLPPLIEPIAQDKKTCVCPFIDVIGEDTFAYTAQDEGARGAFDWQFYYKRLPLLETKNRNPTEPFDNPVMAGGLFAINKEWFYHLGGYDKGLEVWGGEQYELSFKIWQCGGKIVDAPCSRVGHVYRKFNPFSMFSKGDYLSKNYKRVAEIWMDEYKEFIYKKRPSMRHLDAGDISEQVNLRKKLQCKPFKWFMEKVAFDLVKHYPPIPIPPYASGQIRSSASDRCIDIRNGPLKLTECNNNKRHFQEFEWTFKTDMRPLGGSMCFDVSTSEIGDKITLFSCHGQKGNQEFIYDLKSSHIYHGVSRHCVDSNDKNEVFMNRCLRDQKTQEWKFEKLNSTKIAHDFSEDFLKL